MGWSLERSEEIKPVPKGKIKKRKCVTYINGEGIDFCSVSWKGKNRVNGKIEIYEIKLSKEIALKDFISIMEKFEKGKI